MSSKKPASLSGSLLTNRPRKGQAKPQSEAQAARPQLAVVEQAPVDQAPIDQAPAKRAGPKAKPTEKRRRRTRKATPFSAQMNLKVREEDRDRFIDAAEAADITNGEFFTLLLDTYQKANG